MKPLKKWWVWLLAVILWFIIIMTLKSLLRENS